LVSKPQKSRFPHSSDIEHILLLINSDSSEVESENQQLELADWADFVGPCGAKTLAQENNYALDSILEIKLWKNLGKFK
jgi:hypothetical protein